MRTVTIDRARLVEMPQTAPDGCPVDSRVVAEVFDLFSLPDGFGFITNDDGTLTGCEHLNQYLLDAHAQRAYDANSLRLFHMYNLGRLLRYLRRSRAQRSANAEGISVLAWIDTNGEPKVDLTDATREELQAYAAARRERLASTTLQTEFGCLNNFYRYAVESNWVERDPIPRWNGRSTLIPRNIRTSRVSKFLTAPQTFHFLRVGLRGDGAAVGAQPASPERDYCYGLLLATTGLRREEAGLLLDGELPHLKNMTSDGVHAFERSGKGGITRFVYVAEETVRAIELYRQTERATRVLKAQARLRRMRRDGDLFLTEGFGTLRGKPAVVVDGRKVALMNLSDEDRARAVTLNDDGTIEPLGLFVAQGGLPPSIKYWDDLFSDARDRVHAQGHHDRPPDHVTVGPHTMRHTFAVRMLAALMRHGRETSGDPYQFLANPVLTVKELLGHSSIETTHRYLYAAETWNDDVPNALRLVATETVGHILNERGINRASSEYDD